MPVESVAFVGVVGGAGTTRTALELAGVLARAGRSALLLDLDFATQGLARFVDERVEPDAAALLADPDLDLEAAVHEWPLADADATLSDSTRSDGTSPDDGGGRLGLVPAFAPFAELAGAKTPEAGARVADRLAEARAAFDHVLLDVPPVVSNQAVGAVTAAENVVGVIPPTERGLAALQRERGRFADVGTSVNQVLAVGADDGLPADADLGFPPLPGSAPTYQPATLRTDGAFTAEVGTVAAELFDVAVADRIDATGSVVERVGSAVERLS